MSVLSYIGTTVLGKCWKGNFCMLRFFRTTNSKHKLIASSVNESYCGRSSKTCTSLHMAAAGTECKIRGARIRVQRNGSQEFLYSTDVSSTKPNSRSRHFNSIAYFDAEELSLANQNLKHVVKVFAIDIETTGFCTVRERITEIAIRDLQGGVNSCFQTLVNPEQVVPNSHIHGITTEMVKQRDVPRMKELIPILLDYIKSRQIPGGLALFVAHNARRFDVPFLIKEFARCSYDIPPDWLFLDSLPLARETMKLKGSTGSRKLTLSALGEYYGIPLVGSRHRAMSDVNLLSEIVGRLAFDLKLSVSDLLQRSFRASQLIKLNSKKS